MKVLSLLFIVIFLGKSCEDEKQQDLQNTVIEYVANTRGFYTKIIVQNQTATVSKDRNGNDNAKPVKISDADWKALVSAFQNVDLEGISKLKSPTEKRFYDGAAAASIKITYKGKIYESSSFDHGKPPAEIEKLVNKITSF
jgi:hypothetical protein